MNSRSSSNPEPRAARTERARPRILRRAVAAGCVLLGMLASRPAAAGDAPAWLHAVVNAPIPAHDEKTDAVLLYSEKNVTVRSADNIKTVVRMAYKILRPDGRHFGTVVIFFDSQTKISNLHAWCIPAQGKDYEVKEKDGAEVGIPGVPGSDLVVDVRAKVLPIPAPDPGNIVGYEYEQDDHPYFLQDIWSVQDEIPVREAHYSLQLPPGWEYKTAWLNASEIAPTAGPNNQWSWTATDIKALKDEDAMPPRSGIAAQMLVNFLPAAGAQGASKLGDWNSIGVWYNGLLRGRMDPTPELNQKVAQITSGQSTLLAKMQAIALYVQRDVRYVAIELGIGGWQPHPAADVFTHRYGDCKDKVTLMRAMLNEIGVNSYHMPINTERGSVTPEMPGHMGGFDHAILAIVLPDSVNDPSLSAIYTHPKLGRLLIFDPTDDLTPFGEISGALQSSYALLVTSSGGELIQTPRLPPHTSGIHRAAHLTLDAQGNLGGEVQEIRLGDAAARQRASLRNVSLASDRVKPVETLLAHSLASFRILKATVTNLNDTDYPVEFDYAFVAERYAKMAGGMILVRPRVIGTRSSGLLETKEPRQRPVVFDGPERDVDLFEIKLPPGYVADDLPPPVNLDYSFASYHSKAEVTDGVLRYSRTFELKEFLVPMSQIDQLRTMYRQIATDERGVAVLKPGN